MAAASPLVVTICIRALGTEDERVAGMSSDTVRWNRTSVPSHLLATHWSSAPSAQGVGARGEGLLEQEGGRAGGRRGKARLGL